MYPNIGYSKLLITFRLFLFVPLWETAFRLRFSLQSLLFESILLLIWVHSMCSSISPNSDSRDIFLNRFSKSSIWELNILFIQSKSLHSMCSSPSPISDIVWNWFCSSASWELSSIYFESMSQVRIHSMDSSSPLISLRFLVFGWPSCDTAFRLRFAWQFTLCRSMVLVVLVWYCYNVAFVISFNITKLQTFDAW